MNIVRRKYPIVICWLAVSFYVLPKSILEVFGECFRDGLGRLPEVLKYNKVKALYAWEGKS